MNARWMHVESYHCTTTQPGDGCPAESLMCSSRWPYTGRHRLRSSFTLVHFDIYTPQLSERFMCENAKPLSSELSLFLLPFFFPSPWGLHMYGYQHHRRPSRISWYSPCQHYRGAKWLAEFHTLVLESQRTLWACPRNAFWPQPQSKALTASKRGSEARKRLFSPWKTWWHTLRLLFALSGLTLRQWMCSLHHW